MPEDKSTTQAVEYREIPGTNGAYRAGTDGSVWCCLVRGYSKKRGSWRRLNPKTPDEKGYFHIRLRIAYKFCVRPVHRLILEALVGPRPEGMECRHLNGNPGDNRLINLVWGSYQENREDMRRHGRSCRNKSPRCRGPTLTDQEVITIRQRVAAGKTAADVARDMKLNYRTVMRAANGTSWGWISGAIPKTPGREKRVKAILEAG